MAVPLLRLVATVLEEQEAAGGESASCCLMFVLPRDAPLGANQNQVLLHQNTQLPSVQSIVLQAHPLFY